MYIMIIIIIIVIIINNQWFITVRLLLHVFTVKLAPYIFVN